MIVVELGNDRRYQPSLKESLRKGEGTTTIECSCQSQLHIKCRQAMSGKEWAEAHVFPRS